MIHAENLTRKFGALTAVDHLNLDVAEGEIFGLVGPDGAGKTTTMRLLCGLMDPTEGKAIVAGHDVSRRAGRGEGPDRLHGAALRPVHRSDGGREHGVLLRICSASSGREREELSARLLRMTRMEPFRKRPAGKLSGGMKQKLALMCTLLHKPRSAVSGRADQRRRSGFAPRFLGDSVSTGARRADGLRHHGVSGRGRARQSRRLHVSRAA